LLKAHDWREVNVPLPQYERRRKCNNGYDVMFEKTNCTVINKNDKSIVFKGKRI